MLNTSGFINISDSEKKFESIEETITLKSSGISRK